MTLYQDMETDTNWSGEDGLSTEVFQQGLASQKWIVSANKTESASITKAQDITGAKYILIPMVSTISAFYTHIIATLSDGTNTESFIIADQILGDTYRAVTGDWVYNSHALELQGTIIPASFESISFEVNNSSSGNIRSVENHYIDAIYFGLGRTISGTTVDDKLFKESDELDRSSDTLDGCTMTFKGKIFAQTDMIIDTTIGNSYNETIVFARVPNTSNIYNLDLINTHNLVGTNIEAEEGAKVNITTTLASNFSMSGGAITNGGTLTFSSGQVIKEVAVNNSGTINSGGATIDKITINGNTSEIAAVLLGSATELNTMSNITFNNISAAGSAVDAFDVSGGVIGNSFDIDPANSAREMRFSVTGHKMYFLSTDIVYSWDLSVEFDVTTAVASTQLNTQGTTSFAFCLSSDGLTMFSGSDVEQLIYEYNLSTAWDVSSAVYNSVNRAFVSTSLYSLFISVDGLRLFELDNDLDKIYQLNLATKDSLASASNSGEILHIDIGAVSPRSIAFSTDGLNVIVSHDDSVDQALSGVYQYELGTPWSLVNAPNSPTNFQVCNVGEASIYGCSYNTDGTKVYMQGSSLDLIEEYNIPVSAGGGIPMLYIPASVTGTITLDSFIGDDSTTHIYWGGTEGTLTVTKSNGTNFSTWDSAGGTVYIPNIIRILKFTDLPDGIEIRYRMGSETLQHTQDVTGGQSSYPYEFTGLFPITVSFTGAGIIQAVTNTYYLKDEDQSIPMQFDVPISYIN